MPSKGILYREYENDGYFEQEFRVALCSCIKNLYRGINVAQEDKGFVSTIISEEFSQYLSSSGNLFTHSSGLDISLEDIYIPLNLKILDSESKTDKRTNIEGPY